MQCPKDTLEEPSGKGLTSPGRNVTGKDFLSEYEMFISFQANVATSQNTFFKIP